MMYVINSVHKKLPFRAWKRLLFERCFEAMAMPDSGLCMGCMNPLGDYIVCSRCGYDNSKPYDKNYRRPGSVLGSRYMIGRLVRKNGEGGLYVGYDNSLNCRAWIREYFPRTLASRDPATGDVKPLEGCGAQYKALMSDFVDICNEVKRVGVTEPVVPIENVVGERGTVYAIYKDMGVTTFENWLGKRGGKLPVKEARDLLLPLFNSLSNIHARSDIHRGISPYTVYVDKNDKLYLWDFSMSATRTGGSELEAELFNGYSAPEQYASNGWQGTWTDVYGAAALFYRTVSGFVPPKSTMVGDQRPIAPLIDLVMDMPKNISDAVAAAMEPNTDRRTQEIGVFVASLINSDLSSTAVYDVSKVTEVKRAPEEKRVRRAESRRRGKYVVLGMLFTVVALFAVLYVIMSTYYPDLISPDKNVMNPSSSDAQDVQPDSEPERSSQPEVDNSLPNLSGMTVEEAMAATGDRLEFSVQEDYSDRVDKGLIFDQSPRQGTAIADGRTVIVYVSKGKRVLVMPDLTGMTREEARAAMSALVAGEQYDLPYSEYDRFEEGAEPGTVVMTNPAAGTEFDPQNTRSINIFYMFEDESEEESSGRRSASSSGESSGGTGRMTVEEFERQWNSD